MSSGATSCKRTNHDRFQKRKAFREFVRSVPAASQAIHRIVATNILESLERARLNERHATSTRLAGDVFRRNNSEARAPEELSDLAVSNYLADAGAPLVVVG